MTGTCIDLDEAIALTRTGDIWLFRGHSLADRAIQLTTNSPVNHVGMAVVLDDLPAMMWHAELGRSVLDLWSGTHHRGVQLHDLRTAATIWATRYGQRAWLRQIDPPVPATAEDAVLRTIARLDGIPFPSTVQLAGRWLRGRVPNSDAFAGRWLRHRLPAGRPDISLDSASDRRIESAYCAEVAALTYEAMGLLSPGRRSNWYDPGRFWSGDDLELAGDARLGGEIVVSVSETPVPPRSQEAGAGLRPEEIPSNALPD
jgi:hypothetical protein